MLCNENHVTHCLTVIKILFWTTNLEQAYINKWEYIIINQTLYIPGSKNYWPIIGQYTFTILGRYSKMALGQYSFLENSVDIGNWYRPNNNIVIYPISPEYCVNIDFILSCPLKEYYLDTQFLILESRYWLDTQKYHRANIHFWKIRLILEIYIDPKIVLSFSKLRL